MMARTRRAWSSRLARWRVMAGRGGHSWRGAPGIEPEAARVLVAGRLDALEPVRDEEGIGAVEERQRRQLVEIDLLHAAPHGPALAAVELALDGVDQLVHLGILEPGGVLPAPAIGGGRDLGRIEGRARHVLGRGDPGIHRHGRELAVGHGVAEEDARRLVPDAHLDAYGAPLALQHLLDELADAVARRGHQLEGELLSLGVAAHAAGAELPARLVEQRRRLLRIVAVALEVLGVDPVARAHEGDRGRLASAEELGV